MKINSRIGDYEVLGELGRGGMGHVYRVRNVISERIDAMKVVLPDLAGRSDLVARFLREIKLLATLDHPNIATLRTALEVDNQLIMIMEYVEGQTVADRLNFGAIPVGDALIFIDHVLSALDYAHSRDVVHRDIKPANMILTPQGVVKLMDFGIARSGGDQTLTVTGSTTGSLLYMSPEQVQGKEADARSDLYSIGISLYQMVTARLPFDADTSFAVMAAHLQQKPKPPMDVQPAVSQALNDIILKAIEKDPERRFQSAGEFRAALASVRSAVGTAPAAVGTPTATRSPTVVAAFPLPGAAQSNAGRSPTMVDPRNLSPQDDATIRQAAMSSAPMRQGMRHPVAYMVLGGVLVIAALVGAVMYSQRAEANPPADGANAAATAPVPAPVASPAAPAAPPGATETPAATSQPAANTAALATQPGAGGTSAAAAATPSTAASPVVSPPAAKPGAAPGGASASASAAATPAAGTAPAAASQTVAPADAAKPSPAAPTIDWDALEDEIEQLAVRAVSINGSLDRMKSEQARLGVGLRGDVAARQESMNSSIARARDAVAQKNAARAPRLVQVATSDIEFLEKFLGR